MIQSNDVLHSTYVSTPWDESSYLINDQSTNTTVIEPTYAILSKRLGKVISDTMVEGTDLISIVATIPQSESFGLTPELLEKSSGEVSQHLALHHKMYWHTDHLFS